MFETMLALFKDQGLVKAKGRQRTDATHVLAAIHVLNRLEGLGETLWHALNTLAATDPAWLGGWVPRTWFDRYVAALRNIASPMPKPTAMRWPPSGEPMDASC